jgi:hypothetical protein
VGNDVLIGANAVVVSDVPDNSIAVGIPATIKPRQTKPVAAQKKRPEFKCNFLCNWLERGVRGFASPIWQLELLRLLMRQRPWTLPFLFALSSAYYLRMAMPAGS